MKTFIKVTEIWIPNKDRTCLELATGIYGDLTELRSVSEQIRFEFAQGLPGKAWAEMRPVVITDLSHSCFQRTEVVHQARLTCAIAIPVLSGEFLLAVIVFLCGDDEYHAGAIEVWANDADRGNELGVIEGYYGTLNHFEFVSRKTKIMKGFGLPGKVWEKGLPVLMADLGHSESFIRGREAKDAGITTALGIPLVDLHDRVYLMTFLSAKTTPIAKQIEIWLSDNAREHLIFYQGYSAKGVDLAAIYAATSIAKGEGALGRVWLTGIPAIIDHYKTDDASDTLLMPVIHQGQMLAVIVFCL